MNWLVISLLLFISFGQIFSESFQIHLTTIPAKKIKLYQPIHFKISNDTGYVYLFSYHNNGKLRLIFPNEDETYNLVKKKTFLIPSKRSNYEYIVSEPIGIETFVAVLSKEKVTSLHDKKYWTKSIKVQKNLKKEVWLNELFKKMSKKNWTYSEVKIQIIK